VKPGSDDVKLKKWNWAAFLFAPVWILANNLEPWILLLLVPVLNIWALLHLGWNGNRMAYQKSELSVDEFMIVQRKWSTWALRMLGFAIVLMLAGLVLELNS